MCGIFGIFGNKGSGSINEATVTESAKLMKHRGPDAYGQWGIDHKIQLAHLRLSIIDLASESNQPFFSNDENYVVVYNGEIFNYLELKEQLQILGYDFRTSSDTEVLLNAYIEWGDKCVSKFNGDWAFAIYDIKNNILFCSRDRFGVKPFNYAIVNDQFIFSSEIKSIIDYFPQLRNANYNVISNFCRNSLGAQIETTWFEGVYRLLPAHNITITDAGVKIEKYWEYPKTTFKNLSLDQAKDRYKELFLSAVKLRMRSDVPVGTTLSSGLDSSSIVSILRKFYGEQHKTFTAVFNNSEFDKQEKLTYSQDIEINEGDLVKKLAKELKLDAHLISIKNDDFIENLLSNIYYLESGHSSPATLPLAKILDYAKSHVTVVMEGQGADELLSGYILSSFPFMMLEYLKRGNLKQFLKEFIEFKKHYSIGYSLKLFLRLLNNDTIERIYQSKAGINKIFGDKLKKYSRIKDYPLEPPKFDEKFNKKLFESHTGSLVNLLHYGDAISMSKSLESRNPFMDVNLIEFAFQLPFDYKMRNGLGKYIHRISMKGIVPDFILENPIKFGFNSPLSQHFDSMEKVGTQILLSKRCADRGIYNRKGLAILINEHINKRKNNSTMLFRLLSVELWFRLFIDKQDGSFSKVND